MEIRTIEEFANFLQDSKLNGELGLWFGEGYPVLNIYIKGNLAYLHYFPGEGHPGYKSLNGKEHTKMVLVNAEDSIEVSDDSLLEVNTALEAAKEFLTVKSKPKGVSWLEL